MNVEQLRALYRKTTPKRKDLVNERIGTFFEDYGIPEYLDWRSEEFGETIVNESRVDPIDELEYAGKYDKLSYDYYFEVVLRNGIREKYYIECKAKLLGKSNNTFEIQSSKVNKFKQISRRGEIIYLLCNLRNGEIFSIYHNSDCIKKHNSGTMTINTNWCGNSLGNNYAISPPFLNEIMEEIFHILSPNQATFEF